MSLTEHLTAEAADYPFDGDEPVAPRDEYELRKLLLLIASLEAEEARLANLLGRITDEYRGRIATLERQHAAARQSVENFLIANERQKVAFPDVGTAYLGTTRAGLKVVDRHAFETWAAEHGFFKQTVDTSTAKDAATKNGELPYGCEWVPARKTVRIRGAE